MSNHPSCARPLRALIVDDDLDAVILLTILLEMHDVEVIAADSAAQALQKISLKPDILISDLAMPVMDGYALIRKVRQLPPDQGGMMPAIAISAWVAIDTQTQALEAGFQAFVEKPYDPLSLIPIVSKLTGWSPICSELVA